MSFWDKLGDLGNTVVEFAGDTIGGIGDNFQNRAANDAALIDRVKVNNQIALTNSEIEKQRSESNQRLIQNAVYGILGIAFLVVAVWAVSKFLK